MARSANLRRARLPFLSGVRARRFNGEPDSIHVAIGGVNLTGAFTVAALVRKRRDGNADFILTNSTSISGRAVQLAFDTSNRLVLFVGASSAVSTTTVTTADGWVIVAASKAAGSATPRAHIYKGGAWTQEPMSTALGNPLTQASGTVRFGEFAGIAWALMDIAAAAEWTSELSDVNVATLEDAWATQDWADLSPSALWEFDQADVATDVTDLTGNGANETAITGTTAIVDGPAGWTYGAVFTHERAAALDAVCAITASGQVIDGHNRSAALDATADIASSGEVSAGATTHERSAALDATGAIASAATFWTTFERSAAVNGTGAVTLSAFVRELLRSASVNATASIASVPQRDLLRQAALAASAGIATASQRDLLRQAALAATGSIATDYERDHLRQVAFGATANINATGQIEGGAVTHERSASLSATAAITADGHGILARSAAVSATGTVVSAGYTIRSRSASLAATADFSSAAEFFSIFERNAALAATGGISTAGQRDLLRAATLSATGVIQTAGQRDLLRQASLTAIGNIGSFGANVNAWTYNGDPSAAYSGTATMTYGGTATATYAGTANWNYDNEDVFTYT